MSSNKQRQKVRTLILDNNLFSFTSEEDEGEFIEARVEINNSFLCYISYEEIDSFVQDFSQLLSKYRI